MAEEVLTVARMGAKDETGPAFRSIQNNMRNTTKQGKALNNQFRLLRGGAGQVGHQIQDIAVQLQMGTNAMIVFGQQGSQIASLFGPQGAMIGAVLAVGAAISVAFSKDLKKGEDALVGLQDRIEETIGKTREMRKEYRLFLIDQYKKEIRVAEKRTKELTASMEENQELIDRGTELNNHLASTTATAATQLQRQADEAEAASINIRELQEANRAADAELVTLTDDIASFTDIVKDLEGGVVPESFADGVEDAASASEKFIQSLEKQSASLTGGTFAAKAYELAQLNLTGAQLDAAVIALDKWEQTRLQIEADKEAAKATEERRKAEVLLFEQTQKGIIQSDDQRKKDEAAEKRRRKAQLDRLRTFEEFKNELGDTFLQMKKLEDGLVGVTENAMANFTDSFYDAITGAKNFKDAFKDMARSIVEDLSKMLIQYYITQQIFGAITSMFPSGGGGGGTTSTPSKPPAKSTGPIFAGGGFTGYGARSGGVDGKGGFHAILHPNETVIDHQMGGQAGVTIVQNINVSTGVQQTVRAEIANLLPQISNAAKSAVADARMRGGGFSKAMVGT